VLTEDQVRQGYEFILGRQPESAAMRRSLLNSQEFREKTELAVKSVGQHRMAKRPAPDGVAAPEQLARLFGRIREEWEKLGEEEPYWSVLTSDLYRSDRIAENREGFFASGRGDVELLASALARNDLTLAPDAIALELGCGVGRATMHLARRVGQVHALDISPGNLREAQRNLAEQGVANVALRRLSRIEEYDELPEFDLFFSNIVLQHNPPPVVRHVLDRVAARGRPGATLFFQMVTYGSGYSFDVEQYLASPRAGMEVHALRQSAIYEVLAARGYRLHEAMEDDSAGSSRLLSLTFLATRG
jgi:SAM-dependent methyltransferase